MKSERFREGPDMVAARHGGAGRRGLPSAAIRILALIAFLTGVMPPAFAAPSFDAFIQSLWPAASARGVSGETFDGAFARVSLDKSILKLTRKQAEFVKPIWQYLDGAVSQARIETGRDMAREWAETLARAQAQYGVDRHVVLGVWGLETNFGSNTGGRSTIRALATLAYVKYRGTFFRDELLTALEILQAGHIAPENMRGSWAGAMGQTQFMPSSFRDYAVDFNGDGRRDIWNSVPDALGSTANYLKQHGWIAGQTWGYEVTVPENYVPAGADQSGYQSFSRWAQRGFAHANGEALPGSGEASLLLPAGLRGPAFLVTPNFKVIKSYNNSTSYALGVALLGDRIAGRGGLSASWPRGDRTLSPAQSRVMQQLLVKLGYDIGEVDGKLGEKARDALRDWQVKHGLPADGYPTLRLLERMRGGG
jgi:membrane-bound lytic murein transglycosylase B